MTRDSRPMTPQWVPTHYHALLIFAQEAGTVQCKYCLGPLFIDMTRARSLIVG